MNVKNMNSGHEKKLYIIMTAVPIIPQSQVHQCSKGTSKNKVFVSKFFKLELIEGLPQFQRFSSKVPFIFSFQNITYPLSLTLTTK